MTMVNVSGFQTYISRIRKLRLPSDSASTPELLPLYVISSADESQCFIVIEMFRLDGPEVRVYYELKVMGDHLIPVPGDMLALSNTIRIKEYGLPFLLDVDLAVYMSEQPATIVWETQAVDHRVTVCNLDL